MKASGGGQTCSLAFFPTHDSLRAFRLATALIQTVEAADRHHRKPLLRASALPQHAFVLAVSEIGARAVEVFANRLVRAVSVLGHPDSATGHREAHRKQALLVKYASRAPPVP